ncbi:thiosulfate/3-mercaptopyruvate sulfurtransferase [Paracoccus alcaliphilus]|uniref:Thiosulfate/3-mercaptopyruvate sulfurtransferase n=1 Tax=Paracoccus alcaliphilus TaxID=34002 RepID=A0A1H8LBY5_9RHOB|nr:rhodanese-like domain-containing protein [Paracoccus alcaliphilus]WCR20163.1 sulfurtransferase [Paracoccus alcaliphilus]SEO02228.1 thiosulfate/3-mercaptopyruvate sulfurtransferase [Paracoccus alcaliphilus]
MRRLFFSAIAVIGLSGAAIASDFGPLLTPDELQALNGQPDAPLVLDIRGEDYAQGHIEGAVSAPYDLFRGPAENPGALVPEDQLQAVLRDLGVTLERPVVVVHQGSDDSDFGAAARVYWTLKSSGVSHLAILNGGMGAWAAAGLPLETKPNAPVPSEVEITFSDRWLATTDDVAAIVGGQSGARLIDSRPEGFYHGQQSHPAAAKPGTLPGAENISHSVWFDDQTRVMDAPAASDVAARLGIGQQEELVAFCNTGHWAATEWFALSELAGVEDVKLYPDSMVGWSQTGGAMQNTPGLMQNLLNHLRAN